MKRALILLWTLLCLGSLGAGAQNIYLVSAGVSDYPGRGNDLLRPADDAKAVHRLFKKNSKATSVLLTDENANKGRILASARNLFSKAGEDDIVVFFFSGHGLPGGFVAYDEMIGYPEIRRVFAACKAKNKMIFADACFSGDLREGNGTAQNDPGSNVMLFLSSRSNEYSIERRDMRNGIFAACLVRALKGGADTNRDRIITAKELFSAVSAGVKDLSRNRQHPVMWGNFDDSMPVMVWK